MFNKDENRAESFGIINEGNGSLAKKKRKIDVAALQSEFKCTVPSLDIAVARDLIDCGFFHIDEIRGRSPETIFEQIRKIRPQTPIDHLWSIRMMVYFSETSEPDRNLMQPHVWQVAR